MQIKWKIKLEIRISTRTVQVSTRAVQISTWIVQISTRTVHISTRTVQIISPASHDRTSEKRGYPDNKIGILDIL